VLDKGRESEEFDEYSSMSDYQRNQIEKLREQGRSLVGNFIWQEKIIMGEVQNDSPRLDITIAKKIISGNREFSNILEEFEKAQKYPDFVGGSGVSIIEYWLDGNGGEKILIIVEQEQIYFVSSNDDKSSQNYEVMFDKK